jgi:nitrate reductase delta subunit
MKTFRILSALLSYPEQELFDALPHFATALDAEGMLSEADWRAVRDFIEDLAAMPLLDAQERYVALFDRNRSLSLHIYEHVHGESRDRGQAMVRLANLYRLHEMHVTARELPDYLPLFLEFLSIVPERAARSLLADAAHVVAALTEKLRFRGSPYAAVMEAVLSLAARAPQAEAVADIRAALPETGDDLAALDRQWEEEAVRFVAGNHPGAEEAPGCGGM